MMQQFVIKLGQITKIFLVVSTKYVDSSESYRINHTYALFTDFSYASSTTYLVFYHNIVFDSFLALF